MAAPSNPYPALPRAIDPTIVRQIRQASQSSSTDFGLLMAQAAQESGFRPDAKAATGSGAGLFQFIDSTWLDMVHRYGAKYGQGQLAQQIGTNAAGKPTVADAATRHRILALRSDPALSASLAGEYAQQNKGEVEHALGRPVGKADLYMAHFLGAGGATLFLKTLQTKGSTPAAQLLPEAAASNRGVFFDSATGRAKSVAEIYRTLGGRIERNANEFDSLAENGDTPGTAEAVAVPASGTASSGTAASGTASSTPQLSLAALRLSEPVAALLDTLTLAALRLVNGGDPPPPPARRS